MLTVADVLDLEIMARSAPAVVAGKECISAPVRWVHTHEMMPTQMPTAERLILTCGTALPDDGHHMDQLIAELAGSGVSGIVILLGPRYPVSLPSALIRTAERNRMPLITIRPPAHLTNIAEDVNTAIFGHRLDVLSTADEVHRTFTELALEGASSWDVVHHVARLSGRPVVLENLAHQVLAYDPAHQPPPHILSGWEAQSRQMHISGWLVTTVGARGRDWGRLVMLPPGSRGDEAQAPGIDRHTEICRLILQRAADTLALNQLIGSSDQYPERQAHAELLKGLLTHSITVKESALRAAALGLPLEHAQLVGIALRLRGTQRVSGTDERGLERLAVSALRRDHPRALIASLGNGVVGLLIALNKKGDTAGALEVISTRLHKLARENFKGRLNAGPRTGSDVIIAVGPAVESIHGARHTLSAALQTVGAVIHSAYSQGKGDGHPLYFRPQDLHLTGLLRLFHDDSRMHSYVENEIGPLLDHDARHGTNLVSVLAQYLDHGRNKTAAAEAARISRPSLYDRLERIERILSVNLNDAQSCLSLQVALQALDTIRQQGTP
ncbi:PucR family transcriptional regulator (plasmid) [Streptomyces sp. CA-142005]|uniref:PucR family transcriptional regulator n=1 Tax=Streptomyces sp. CA-142005 TaxID=3240052 RepID=UPI003D8AF560